MERGVEDVEKGSGEGERVVSEGRVRGEDVRVGCKGRARGWCKERVREEDVGSGSDPI